MKVRKFRHGAPSAVGNPVRETGLSSSRLFSRGSGSRPLPVIQATQPIASGLPAVRKARTASGSASASGQDDMHSWLAGISDRLLDGDRHFLASAALLLVIGMFSLWSGSAGYGLSSGRGDTEYFVSRQLVFLIPTLIAFCFCSFFPLELMRRFAFLAACLTLVLLWLPTISGLGRTLNGASRWMKVGANSFQPSELWKPVLVFYIAHNLDRKKESLGRIAGTIAPPLVIMLMGSFAIYVQSNASTALLAGLAGIGVLWASGISAVFLGLSASILAPLGLLTILVSDYRMERIVSFIARHEGELDQNYQRLSAYKAIASGGMFGKGIGLGTRKVASIPIVHADFIFASVAEETGFAGVLAIMALWVAFFTGAFRIAFSQVGFRSSLAFGLAFVLCIQVLANLGVVAGVLPTTGLALPFFSAGGSSLLMTGICVGLLYNCSRPGASR